MLGSVSSIPENSFSGYWLAILLIIALIVLHSFLKNQKHETKDEDMAFDHDLLTPSHPGMFVLPPIYPIWRP